jgi:Mn2+/Fe2+ NRAMP family transporter
VGPSALGYHRVTVTAAPTPVTGAQATPASRFWQTFGPGMLWAAAAIGVSHLVQSTRAGADGGFSLAWVVVVALALKYPFFEFGPRYAAGTGESLVEGYLRQGRWALWLYLALSIVTAIAVGSAVGLFTAFLFAHVLGLTDAVPAVGAGVTIGGGLLLWFGRFNGLDWTNKVVLAALAACTITAAAFTLPQAGNAEWIPWPAGDVGAAIPFAFILALVGWMPAGMDLSVQSSLWTLAKNRSSGVTATVREAVFDFRIGYIGTSFIALAFLMLGATVMHRAGESFSPEGAIFSIQLVDLYAATLGEWSRPIILVAVLTTMGSTTLAILDAFPRAIARTIRALADGIALAPAQERETPAYWGALGAMIIATILVFNFFTGTLHRMVDAATILGFITAPVLGYLNLRAVTAPHVSAEFRPGRALQAFSWLGLALLAGTALVFIVRRLFL